MDAREVENRRDALPRKIVMVAAVVEAVGVVLGSVGIVKVEVGISQIGGLVDVAAHGLWGDRELMAQGLDRGEALRRFTATGGHTFGICGGMQMLGRELLDPEGLEGQQGGQRFALPLRQGGNNWR